MNKKIHNSDELRRPASTWLGKLFEQFERLFKKSHHWVSRLAQLRATSNDNKVHDEITRIKFKNFEGNKQSNSILTVPPNHSNGIKESEKHAYHQSQHQKSLFWHDYRQKPVSGADKLRLRSRRIK